MRADVLFRGDSRSGGYKQYILDVRTCNPTEKSVCSKAASEPGAAALAGVTEKNNKWKHFVDAQGDVFLALCFEAGGRLGDQVLGLLDLLAQHAYGSGADRDAFLIYARQRVQLVNQIAVARVIRAHEPICDGPCVINLRGTLDLGTPVPRPLGVAVAKAGDLSPAWIRSLHPGPSLRSNSTNHTLVPGVTGPPHVTAAVTTPLILQPLETSLTTTFGGPRPPLGHPAGGDLLQIAAPLATFPRYREAAETNETTNTSDTAADGLRTDLLHRTTLLPCGDTVQQGTAAPFCGAAAPPQTFIHRLDFLRGSLTSPRPNGLAIATNLEVTTNIPTTLHFSETTAMGDLADIAMAAAAFSLLGE